MSEGGLLFIIVVLGCVLVLLVFFFFREKRQQEARLRRMIEDVRQINRQVYDLRIDENEEGALSGLSNEIYKTAVLLKEVSLQSQRESEALSRALADVSHQIKTPMTSAQIALDNLMAHPEMAEADKKRFLMTLRREMNTIESLTVQLLQLAKFDSGTIRMRKEAHAIGKVIGAAADSLDVLFDVRGVAVRMTGDTDLTLMIDRAWEEEAYKNILKNCAEHSKEGGTIEVIVEDLPLFASVKVKDAGEGIAQEDLTHIFERFYKGKNAAKDSIGIGLHFAKTIFTADGADISVKSRPGEGTTFTVRYPKGRR